MRAAVRIGQTYFCAVPLQSWLNVIGGALLLLGLLPVLLGSRSPNAILLATLGILLGGTFIAMTPALLGGAILRFASTRAILHLRPHGRQQLLLGTTLALTMLAFMATTAHQVLAVLTPAKAATSDHFLQLPAFHVFAASWSILAAVWVAIFTATAHRLGFVLLWFVPLLMTQDRIRALVPAPPDCFAYAAAGWIAFCLWYLRTPAIRRVSMVQDTSSTMFEQTPAGSMQSFLESLRPSTTVSRATTLRQLLLGSPSVLGQAWFVIWIGALLLILLFAFLPQRGPRTPQVMLMIILVGNCGTIGYAAVRRARLLWLRIGGGREALFDLAERHAFPGTMVMLVAGAGVTLAANALTGVAITLPLLLFITTQIAFGICVLYGGLTMTGNWTVARVLAVVGFVVLLMVNVGLLVPRSDISISIRIAAIGVLLLLAGLLRAWALHSWRTLDWRVAQLPRTVSGTDSR